MGIQGLLPQLKSTMAPIGVEDLRGQTVAVDTYSWLHKGAFSCGDRLCKGIPTTRHIEYCMHRVNLLRHHGVKPVLVFDGGLLPIKGDQEIKRERSRKENLERAREHEAAGNSRAAFECYQKAVDITPRIASELIQVLKKEKVDYIVAPYEADAQMTFLSVNKLVDAVITEDSDLIPFGCSRIIFKMDKFGQGVEFQIARLERNRELDFNGFTKQMLLEMCILSGCDYLPSLPGMGVKRAHALIQKLKSHEKVIKHLRYNAVSVPPRYEENFKKAIWAFQFQRVYDPASEDIVHLSGIPDGLSEDDFLGPWLPQAVVKGIAVGDIDPLTKEPFEIITKCSAPGVDKVYPIRDSIVPSNGKKRLDLPVQKNILTNYFCLASLEAKRKFRAPKVTPKQQILDSSLCSPQTENYGTPDSTEDTSLPTNNNQASQCSSEHFSSEPFQDDSVKVSQCSSERFSSDFPRYDSASVSPQCSYDVGSDSPFEDPCIEDTNYRKIEVNYCNGSTIPTSSCFDRKLSGSAEPFVVSPNTEPSRPMPLCTESNISPTDRNIIVKSSYFKTVNKRVYTNQEDKLDEEDNCETDNWAPSGGSLRNPVVGGVLKRRKLCDPPNVQDETLQSTSSHENPVDNNEGHTADCNTDSLDGINTNSEGTFGCNVSHVNKYSGIAEKSMAKFASQISSSRYPGSRASGLRAPLKDVKNTIYRRSALRPQEQNLSCTAQTARGPHSQRRFVSDAPNSTDGPPDLSTFGYRPIRTTAVRPDQMKTINKASDGSSDLRALGHVAATSTVSCPDQSKNAHKAMCIADGHPDLSTFVYKPIRTADADPDQWKATNKAADGPVDLKTKGNVATRSTVSSPDQSKKAHRAMSAADGPPDLSTFAYAPTTSGRSDRSKFSSTAMGTVGSPPDLSTFAYKPMKTMSKRSIGSRFAGTTVKTTGQEQFT